MKVLKFGGSSLSDAKQYQKVRSIVEADKSRRVVIVSAPGKRFSDDHKITDLLYLCHAHLQYGVACDTIFEMIAERYRSIARDLSLSVPIDEELAKLRDRLSHGASQDEIVSRGEYLSAILMADYLGFDFIDAERWIKFRFDGTVDREASYEALRGAMGTRGAVIPGFYGAMPNGSIKTFSRGGSDITGALAAAALKADVYENWTDVSGILMADPRIVENPEPIAHVTYDELRQLSYIGAQVLHEGTIFPVREAGIPLNIRNTNEPEHPGTLIMEKFDDAAEQSGRFITGIAGRRDFSVINITKNGLSSAVGIMRRIAEIFEAHNVPIEYTPSGIDTINIVTASSGLKDCLYSIMGEIEKSVQPNSIHVTEGIAVVAAVGRKMAYRPGISGKIFATLGENGINIRMISQGPDELNIIVGVDNRDFAKTVRVLYHSFVK